MKHLVLFSIATLIVATAPVFAAPIVPNASGASYTFDVAGKAYFVFADTSLNADIAGNDLYVGKSSIAPYNTLAGSATFTIGAGANATRSDPVGDGLAGYGVRTFGDFRTDMTGGTIANLFGADNSQTSISAGAVELAVFSDSADVSLSGIGSVTNLFLGGVGIPQDSVATISGGVFTNLTLLGNTVANITGGIVPTVAGSGISLFGTSTQANIFGTGLSATYLGIDGDGFDAFNVTGTLQDGTVYTPSAPLPVRVQNGTGTPNSTQRQFAFNPAAVVPEAGTFALLLPGIVLGGLTVIRRRKVVA
ncbi:MAG: hypothetical protein H8F28_25515 [Fibrella sp.]|nr:hypothetical protein [Armatimonadota bacterium]